MRWLPLWLRLSARCRAIAAPRQRPTARNGNEWRRGGSSRATAKRGEEERRSGCFQARRREQCSATHCAALSMRRRRRHALSHTRLATLQAQCGRANGSGRRGEGNGRGEESGLANLFRIDSPPFLSTKIRPAIEAFALVQVKGRIRIKRKSTHMVDAKLPPQCYSLSCCTRSNMIVLDVGRQKTGV